MVLWGLAMGIGRKSEEPLFVSLSFSVGNEEFVVLDDKRKELMSTSAGKIVEDPLYLSVVYHFRPFIILIVQQYN